MLTKILTEIETKVEKLQSILLHLRVAQKEINELQENTAGKEGQFAEPEIEKAAEELLKPKKKKKRGRKSNLTSKERLEKKRKYQREWARQKAAEKKRQNQ